MKTVIALRGIATILDAVSLEFEGRESLKDELDNIRCQIEDLREDLEEDLQEINAAPAEPWYMNIPKGGIKCYVSDVNPNPCFRNPIGLVRQYNSRLSLPFQFSGYNAWKYATPVNGGAIT